MRKSPNPKANDESVGGYCRTGATAAPTLQNVQEAAKSTTLDQGTGQSRRRARVTWQKELLAHLTSSSDIRRIAAGGAPRFSWITITLNRMGRVLSASVTKGSGDRHSDHAAVAMVERASPVPPPPPLIADEGLDFSLPVIFKKARNKSAELPYRLAYACFGRLCADRTSCRAQGTLSQRIAREALCAAASLSP